MLKEIHDLFFPHLRNNHRAKLIHNINILLILALFVGFSISTYFINNVRPDILGISYSISEAELLILVNKEREIQGLPPLQISPKLSDAARRKAADMFEKNYWAHFAPDGSTTPWKFIKDSGYDYEYAGENLAKGFTNSSSAVGAWMESTTHRDNILSSKYQDIGFAIVPGRLEGEETVLIVEIFGSTTEELAVSEPVLPSSVSVEDSSVEEIEETEEDIFPQTLVAAEATMINSKPVIDISTLAKAFSAVGFSFLAFAFAADLVIVERKKIPRIVGHNLDHIMLIAMFIFFILFIKGGSII